MTGSLPKNLPDIRTLKVLNLQGNQIGGGLPDNFAAFSQMKVLDLSHNQIKGDLPATIMNVTYPYPTWGEINLSYNQLTGSIPNTWFGPKNPSPFDPILGLQVLNLGYNKLTGVMPYKLDNMHLLTTLLLDYNDMSGVLPSGLLSTWLGSRKYCNIAGNNFTCPLPAGVDKACQAVCH
jgi:protein brassinosteroid insensitive 1